MSHNRFQVVESVGDHVSFYIPQYAALQLGVYPTEGLDISLISLPWKQGERRLRDMERGILIAGPMRTMRFFEIAGQQPMSFAVLACHQPFSVVSSQPTPDFRWTDLRGRRLINFGEVETPIVCMRYIFREYGLRCDDVQLVDGLLMSEAINAFEHGYGDFLLAPADTTQELLSTGRAFLAKDLASSIGRIPFTSYACMSDSLLEHADALRSFMVATAKTARWIANHSSDEVATLVQPFFPSTAPELLSAIVKQYQAIGIWPEDPAFTTEDFAHYRDVLVKGGWLRGTVQYADVVSKL